MHKSPPYPGLRPYEAEDHALFFGRDAQISAMLDRLEENRFVAVVGSSGCGKSSLVRAGLLPILDRGFLGDATDWLKVVIRPGHEPYERLAEELAGQAGKRADVTAVPLEKTRHFVTPMVTELRRSETGLLDVIGALSLPKSVNVLVVVDQFEELFGFRRADSSRANVASRDEAAAFVRLLLRSALAPDQRVWVVITMRSDFMGDCEVILGLPEAVSRGQFLVPRLDRPQMREAIVGPGRLKGMGYDPFTFEDGLVTRIINEAGDRPDQLPLMQHALMRTWAYAAGRNSADVLEISEYEAAGGIANALSAHAEEALAEFNGKSPERRAGGRQERLVERVFCALCTRSAGGEYIRRPATLAELAVETGFTAEEVGEVVGAFCQADRCFLVAPQGRGLRLEDRIDISHESLIRQWTKLRKWIRDEADSAAQFVRLRDTAVRYGEKKAALLIDPELSLAEAWAKQQQPSETWAKRYGGGCAKALDYLAASQAERKNVDEAKNRAIRIKGRLIAAFVISVAVFAVYLFTLHHRLSATAKELENAQLEKTNLAADVEALKARKEEYEGAVKALEQRKKKADELFLGVVGSQGNTIQALRAFNAAGGGFRKSPGNGEITVEFLADTGFSDDVLLEMKPVIEGYGGNWDAAVVLKLSRTKVTDRGLAHISRLSQLKSLDLSDCERITDEGLRSLEQSAALPLDKLTLNLRGCRQLGTDALARLKAKGTTVLGP